MQKSVDPVNLKKNVPMSVGVHTAQSIPGYILLVSQQLEIKRDSAHSPALHSVSVPQ